MFTLSKEERKLLINAINYYLKKKKIRDTNIEALSMGLQRISFLPINEQKIYLEDLPKIINVYIKHKPTKKLKNLLEKYNKELKQWEELNKRS